MDMRSSLGRVLGLGSARDGTSHFWLQRLTAIASIPFFIFFVAFLIIYSGSPYATIVAVLSNPFVAVIMALGLVSSFLHMKLGMQVVIEDYVHSKPLKFMLIVLNTFFVFSITTFCLFSILKIALKG